VRGRAGRAAYPGPDPLRNTPPGPAGIDPCVPEAGRMEPVSDVSVATREETSGASTADGAGAPSGASMRLRYLPGLDGLRALAVIGVLLYHAEVPWAPGGFLGVEMFFAISGYLITALLLGERIGSGTIVLRDFWLRRARRLLPALYLFLAVTSVYVVLFLPHDVVQFRGDLVAALLYVTNWFFIFHNQSYFAFTGRPPLLQHLWSLAVEEQFYLFWPLVFGGLMRVWGHRRDRNRLLAAVVGGAVASTLLMAVLYHPGQDPSRVYYGTDTRAAGLLIGAALALVWSPWRLTPRITLGGRIVLDLVGVAGVALLCVYMWKITEFDTWLYRGGFALVSLTTALVVAVAAHPGADVGRRVLGVGALRWIGIRSYGIYLWHFPIFMVTRPRLDQDLLSGYPLLAVRLALTFAVAELSFRYVEQPIRAGALGRFRKRLTESSRDYRILVARRSAAIGAVSLLVAGLVVLGLVNGRPAPLPPGLEGAATAQTTFHLPPPPPSTHPPATTASTTPPSTATATTGAPGAVPATTPPTTVAPIAHISAIGDSVMLGAQAALQARFPGIYVNAAVSRQFPVAIDVARQLAAAGRLGDGVIIHIGNNGLITNGQFDALMQAVSSARRVVVLTLQVPRRWEVPNNDVIRAGVARYPNAVLLEWHHIGHANPGWFWEDGIHLRPEGARAYADLIAQKFG